MTFRSPNYGIHQDHKLDNEVISEGAGLGLKFERVAIDILGGKDVTAGGLNTGNSTFFARINNDLASFFTLFPVLLKSFPVARA